MTEQLDLDLAKQGPVVSAAEIRTLTDWLAGRGWVRGAAITEALGLDERKIRAIAEASDGLVISGPGCPGYKLLSGAAELRDVDQAASRLESQAKRMLHRANSLRRRAHALLH